MEDLNQQIPPSHSTLQTPRGAQPAGRLRSKFKLPTSNSTNFHHTKVFNPFWTDVYRSLVHLMEVDTKQIACLPFAHCASNVANCDDATSAHIPHNTLLLLTATLISAAAAFQPQCSCVFWITLPPFGAFKLHPRFFFVVFFCRPIEKHSRFR